MSKLRTSIDRALAAGVLLLALNATGASPDMRIRLGMSDTLLQDINETEARAAVKVWADSLAATVNLEIDGLPMLMHSHDIVRAISTHQLDGFSITMPEYARVASFVDTTIFIDEGTVKQGLEYVLLVRRDSGMHDLSELRGRTVLVCQGPTMILAAPWLEILLAGAKLEPSDRFFGGIKRSSKASQAVLPLYFGTADAGLVTRRAFDTMCEMNPQLRQKLQILASSPKLITAFFAVHKDAREEIKNRIKQALTGYYETPNGRQILMLFQSGRLIAVDTSILRPSVDLLANYERLKARKPH